MRNNSSDDWPDIGESYEHRNGNVYKVMLITNLDSTRLEQYPITVVYINLNNGTIWSRPVNDWFRSFKKV
jgi:hypothetical protein